MRHLPSCQVIDFRDRLMMIDCGEGAQLQMRRMGLKFSRLRHIFISHMHGDHFFGLPGLLSTMALHSVGGTVTVHLFQEGADILRRIMEMFCGETSFDIEYNIIRPERAIILDEPALTVETVPLYHRVPTVGFIFRERPKERHLRGDMVKYFNIPLSKLPAIKSGADFIRDDGTVISNSRLTTDADPSVSYGYISDTAFDPRTISAFRGVETLYHEATYADAEGHKAAPRGHSTAREAGKTARKALAKRLILGHFSKMYTTEHAHTAEAAQEFGGEIIAANEGMRISLL